MNEENSKSPAHTKPAGQGNLGQITGAQASLYARAQNGLDLALPLIEGLTPLLPNPDLGAIDFIRSILRDELNEIVGEIGQPGGPRAPRVESLFRSILGPSADHPNPAPVEAHLKQLGHHLGMNRSLVNTVEDEQNLTNFLILVDYVNSLYSTWAQERHFFLHG